MKELRKRENGKIVYDARLLLKEIAEEDAKDGRSKVRRVLIKMKKGPITYTSTQGTRFFKEHPFQLVSKEEADHLLAFGENNFVYFVKATLDNVEDYYAG